MKNFAFTYLLSLLAIAPALISARLVLDSPSATNATQYSPGETLSIDLHSVADTSYLDGTSVNITLYSTGLNDTLSTQDTQNSTTNSTTSLGTKVADVFSGPYTTTASPVSMKEYHVTNYTLPSNLVQANYSMVVTYTQVQQTSNTTVPQQLVVPLTISSPSVANMTSGAPAQVGAKTMLLGSALAGMLSLSLF